MRQTSALVSLTVASMLVLFPSIKKLKHVVLFVA
jgi:hypothetical protein